MITRLHTRPGLVSRLYMRPRPATTTRCRLVCTNGAQGLKDLYFKLVCLLIIMISTCKVIKFVRFGCRITECRYASTVARFQLSYKKFGHPVEEVELVESNLSYSLKPNEVLLRILAAPIHPADINTIQGVYGIKPALPRVAGMDCIADVLEIGSGVTRVNLGDRVLPVSRIGLEGAWQTHCVCAEDILYKVPDNISGQTAINITTNPFTAYRMLLDFVSLQKGDTVMQNLANSAVGQAVIQISHHLGFKTVNIVRNRPSIEELKLSLKKLGADYVITEEDLRTQLANEIFETLHRPKLGLNGTSGRSATDMIRWLEDGGTVVTYGGMSKQPLTASIGSLIFKDITYRGFWCSRWLTNQREPSEISTMLEVLLDMASQGKFQPPSCNLVPVKDYKKALSEAMQPFSNKKQILVMSDSFK